MQPGIRPGLADQSRHNCPQARRGRSFIHRPARCRRIRGTASEVPQRRGPGRLPGKLVHLALFAAYPYLQPADPAHRAVQAPGTIRRNIFHRHLTTLPGRSRPRVLEQALRQAGWRGLHRWVCFVNWYHPLDGASFADYLRSRPSPLAQYHQAQNAPIPREQRGRIVCAEHRRGPGLGPASVHGRLRAELEAGRAISPLRTWLDGTRRAAWLAPSGCREPRRAPDRSSSLVSPRRYRVIFKLAYDEAYRSMSAGTVLSAHLMEHVIEQDRVHTVDYLTGDDSYKETG